MNPGLFKALQGAAAFASRVDKTSSWPICKPKSMEILKKSIGDNSRITTFEPVMCFWGEYFGEENSISVIFGSLWIAVLECLKKPVVSVNLRRKINTVRDVHTADILDQSYPTIFKVILQKHKNIRMHQYYI